ncbi:MAG: 50S ribosomal protein L10 [Dethiobacteria bacterium]|nr:50S ribosomal protein L10 [Bacillota bacterium]MDW7730536.1 50S ribosomal protein L10 [Bacillota bacterium]
MLTKKAKEKMLEEVTAELKSSELVIVTDYRGLNVKAISVLRSKLRDQQCSYRVTKNTMNRLACRQAGVEEIESLFEGPTAIAYSNADPVAAAKVFNEFARENEALVVKGGLLSGQLLDPAGIKALGDIPPREVLLARVVGGFQAPISGLVGVLQGTLRQLVYTMDAVRQQKESA